MRTLIEIVAGLAILGNGKIRWAVRWKPAINAFMLAFADRFPAPRPTK